MPIQVRGYGFHGGVGVPLTVGLQKNEIIELSEGNNNLKVLTLEMLERIAMKVG